MAQTQIRTFGASAIAFLLALLVTSPVAAQSGYQIRPGDTLRIEVLEDSSLNRNTLVLPDGTISFPLSGTLKASGRTVSEVQGSIAEGLAANFAATPNVFVSVNTLVEFKPGRSSKSKRPVVAAYAMGEVAKPGKMEVDRGTTILQFLAEAGGLTKFAADKRIELRRTDPKSGAVTTYLFSMYGQAKTARIPGSTVLQPGDVIVVPERRLFE